MIFLCALFLCTGEVCVRGFHLCALFPCCVSSLFLSLSLSLASSRRWCYSLPTTHVSCVRVFHVSVLCSFFFVALLLSVFSFACYVLLYGKYGDWSDGSCFPKFGFRSRGVQSLTFVKQRKYLCDLSVGSQGRVVLFVAFVIDRATHEANQRTERKT